MSMGNYPNSANTVSKDFVKEQCPQEYQNFIDALEKAGIDFPYFCDNTFHDYDYSQLSGLYRCKDEKSRTFKIE